MKLIVDEIHRQVIADQLATTAQFVADALLQMDRTVSVVLDDSKDFDSIVSWMDAQGISYTLNRWAEDWVTITMGFPEDKMAFKLRFLGNDFI